ncbi:nucleotidyltransferase family protein [uncultured Aquimarina sp.]|uniref:nucleotidyltransferase family protein n=1 Tax=uncultured Aquimarina sp. TaxID=575652 RepID=UPI00262C92DB|nr:nucleotidyltransferase family protein [uncultured Aquimarina sp.]
MIKFLLIIKNVVHIILAAGPSSRMGTPKQLLPWQGDSLIVNEIKKSLDLKLVETYVVLGANFELIEKEINCYSIHILKNKQWKLGMGSSINHGIRHLMNNQVDFDAVLFSLVDQPLIKVQHLSNLISKFDSNPNRIVATKMKSRIGVPAIFPKTFCPALSKLEEDFGARYIIEKHKDDLITIDGGDKTIDIDTLEQYNALLKREKE